MRAHVAIAFVVMIFALTACQPITPANAEPANAAAPAASPSKSHPESADIPSTGIVVLDSLAQAVAARDGAAMRASILYTEIPCSDGEGLGAPPPCPDGAKAGTPVRVLPIAETHLSFASENDLNIESLFAVAPLFAVYEAPEVTTSVYAFPELAIDWPTAAYVMVYPRLDNPRMMQSVLVTAEGQIMRVAMQVVETPQDALPEGAPLLYQAETGAPEPPVADGPTGVPAVDALAAIVAAGDQAALTARIKLTSFACTHADGLGGPPKCDEAQAEGSTVNMLPVLDASAVYTTGLRMEMGPLAAVYRVPNDALTPDPDWPRGEYALLYGLTRANAALTLFADADGMIVRAAYHWLSPRWAADSLLPAGVEVLYRTGK